MSTVRSHAKQIMRMPWEHAVGARTDEVCRRHNLKRDFYKWKSK